MIDERRRIVEECTKTIPVNKISVENLNASNMQPMLANLSPRRSAESRDVMANIVIVSQEGAVQESNYQSIIESTELKSPQRVNEENVTIPTRAVRNSSSVL